MTDKCEVSSCIARSISTSESDERIRRFLLISLCVLAAIAGRLCYLIRPFDSDGAIFIYQGKVVAEGGRYVHDFVDNKFPTVGLMTSFFWRIWGNWWPGYVLSGAAMAVASCVILARAARRHFGEHAFTPALLMGLVYLNFNFAVFGGFQLETIQIFFACVAASAALNSLSQYAGRRRGRGFCSTCRYAQESKEPSPQPSPGVPGEGVGDAFLVGLVSGCGAMLKPTGVAALVAFAIFSTWRFAREPRRLLAIALFAACGFAIPLTVAVTYLMAADNLRDLPAIYQQIRTYAANSAWNAGDIIKPLIVLGMLAFPIFIRGGIFRRVRDRRESTANRYQLSFIVLWLAIELAGVVAQRRMYAYHFLVLAPPAILLFAAVPRRDRIIPLTAALAPMALFSIYGGALTIELTYRNYTRMPISDYLASRAPAGSTVWQDDYPRLLIETGLRPGSRIPLTFLFANYDQAPLNYARIILEDFGSKKPDFVILPADFDRYVSWHANNILEFERFPVRRTNYVAAWNQIREYVQREYVMDRRIDTEQVWRRSEVNSTPTARSASARPIE